LLAPLYGASRADIDRGITQYQRGAHDRALQIFRDAYESEPPATNVYAAISLFMVVKCNFELGNYDQLIHDSRIFEQLFSDTRYLPDVLFERAKALAMKQQFYPSMVTAIRVLSLTEDPALRKDVMTFSDDLARYYLQPSDFDILSSLIIGNESLAYLKLLWAERSIAAGDFSEADRVLQEVKNELKKADYAEKYKEIISYLNKSRKQDDTEINIAVVLPLTGRHSETGTELLDGIKYAYESYRGKSKNRVNLIIVDTESRIRSGLNNLKKLLEMQNIAAVIGPVSSDMAVSMAPLCEYAGVPLITPTATADNLVDMGASIFQLNPEQQQRAIALADYASDSLSCKRFAVIAPVTEYGLDITASFTRGVERNGGQVVHNVWYSGTPTDINDKLAELKEKAEYLPRYFSYLDGFYRARAEGLFDVDTAEVVPEEVSMIDSIFAATDALDPLRIDSLYAIVQQDTITPPPDTTFLLESLWPDDTTVYDILIEGTLESTENITDTLIRKLSRHAGGWLSPEITLEDKYYTIITDSICILLEAIEDNQESKKIEQILAELEPVQIGPDYIGSFYFSKLTVDTTALAPYIDLALVESLKKQLTNMDSLSAIWLLSEVDTILFPYIFNREKYGIDAVYIPIPQDHIQYIAPQWSRNRFNAYLLGDGNWYQTNILNRYRTNIDSMIIASDYYWDSRALDLRQFARGFQQKTNKQPSRIHIYGYESMKIVMDILEKDASSPREIRDELSLLQGTHGIIRHIRFAPEKPRSSSGVRLIRFYKGNITPLN